jgi:hypothetical protein
MHVRLLFEDLLALLPFGGMKSDLRAAIIVTAKAHAGAQFAREAGDDAKRNA